MKNFRFWLMTMIVMLIAALAIAFAAWWTLQNINTT
jgi:NhaP-type Na+/H+ or K+/H+ antiporter